MLSSPLFGGGLLFSRHRGDFIQFEAQSGPFFGHRVTSFSLQHVNKLCIFDGSVFNCSSCDVIVWTIAEPLHDICDCVKQLLTDVLLVFVK